MQSSNSPSKFPVPFANSGTKNAIPTASQIGITPGAASLTDGFPPLTFTPLSAGGVPPAGADFNGILNMLSAAAQWAGAGGQYQFDSTFSSTIGGYPKGAVLLSSDGQKIWQSTVDNNETDPDSAASANWRVVFIGQIATYSDLQSIDTTAIADDFRIDVTGRATAGDGGGGTFRWMSGDQSALVNGDPNKITVVAPSSDTSGASGVWSRLWNVFEKLNIKWGGVKGDGSDESAAIQGVLDFLPNGRTLFVPNGDYLHSQPLTFDKLGCAIEGELGVSDSMTLDAATVFEFTGTGTALTVGDSTGVNNRSGLHLLNIHFKGTISADYGVRIYTSSAPCSIERCKISGYAKSDAVGLAFEDHAQMWRLESLVITGCYRGAYLKSVNNQIRFNACYIHDNAEWGVVVGSTSISGAVGLWFEGGTIIEFNGGGDVQVVAADSVTFDHCYMEVRTSPGGYSPDIVCIEVGDVTGASTSPISDGITIRDCYFTGNSECNYGIRCSAKRFSNLLLENNTYSNFVNAFVDNSAVDPATNAVGYMSARSNRQNSGSSAEFTNLDAAHGLFDYLTWNGQQTLNRGSITVSSSATTGTVTVNEANAQYNVVLTPSTRTGTPASGSWRIFKVAKSAANFTISLEVAPGSGNSVSFDWQIVR